MHFKHYLSALSLSFAFSLIPNVAQASTAECFITDSSVCVFTPSYGHYGLDLSNVYSQQQLIAEIAAKYAKIGNFTEANRLFEMLTIDSDRTVLKEYIESRQSLDTARQQISSLLPESANSRPEENVSNSGTSLTTAEKIELIKNAQAALDIENKLDREEALIPIIIRLQDAGFAKEASMIFEPIEEPLYRSLILIFEAEIDIEHGEQDLASIKLKEAFDLALQMECNSSECDTNTSRILRYSPHSLLLKQNSSVARCFVTNADTCIFKYTFWGNFALDLTNASNQLLPEIAVKYAQFGEQQKVQEILDHAPALKDKITVAIASLPKTQTPSISPPRQITEQQKQQLVDRSKTLAATLDHDFTANEKLVRIAVEMAEYGLFSEAGEVRQKIQNPNLQILVLINFADIHNEQGYHQAAKHLLDEALMETLSLMSNDPLSLDNLFAPSPAIPTTSGDVR